MGTLGAEMVRIGTGLMGTLVNGYLVLQGNLHFRDAQFKQFLELLARKRLGYPLG